MQITIGQTLTCAETGKQFTAARDGCSFNYATDHEGRVFSDEGVHLREVRGLLDRSRPFTCYLSADGHHVTGWKGNVLGTVLHWSVVRVMRTSFTHGATMRAVRVRDVHGNEWCGRGSPGIVITLRPAKG